VRVSENEVSSDRSLYANPDVTDGSFGASEERQKRRHSLLTLKLVVRQRRTDLDKSLGYIQVAKLTDLLDVDEEVGPQEVLAHEYHKLDPARVHDRPVP
jgi:hypothetical protein